MLRRFAYHQGSEPNINHSNEVDLLISDQILLSKVIIVCMVSDRKISRSILRQIPYLLEDQPKCPWSDVKVASMMSSKYRWHPSLISNKSRWVDPFSFSTSLTSSKIRWVGSMLCSVDPVNCSSFVGYFIFYWYFLLTQNNNNWYWLAVFKLYCFATQSS